MKKNLTVKSVKVYYLKMNNKPNINLNEIESPRLSKLELPIMTDDYIHYYRTVGEKYNWNDRIHMNRSKLYDIINSKNTEIFIYKIKGKTAGFAEFVREKEYTEILYFGLFPEYIGKGLGEGFLKRVIEISWNREQKWTQLNTCELDHPNALSTYKKSGFEIDKIVVENRTITD